MRQLRIALPGLADAAALLAVHGMVLRLPAAEWIAARGQARVWAEPDWRDWVLADAGLPADVLRRFPAGPCSAPGEPGQHVSRTWARAEPVHLVTAIDHLQLAAPVPMPLEAHESSQLLDALNSHLAGTGFALSARASGGWVCECPRDLECRAAVPAEALGRDLREWLPTGRDATRVRSLVNEMQMLLHEHPVNERRAARGLPPVNSVWLWGFGATRAPSSAVDGDLVTDDSWLADLWRLHGGRVRTAAELRAALAGEAAHVRVALGVSIEERCAANILRALDAEVLVPARAALGAASVSSVMLHTGRSIHEVTRAARWRFWRGARPLAEVLA
jgi:hypothetical protein